MTCPYHSGGSSEDGESTDDGERGDRSLDRESFMKAALAIGGTSALSTAESIFDVDATVASESDRVTVRERANRQHAWDAYERFSERHGASLTPAYHLLLHLDYAASGPPDPADRSQVADALDALESAFEWSHEGLLFTVGYSAAYFERFATDGDRYPLPRGLDPANQPKPGLLTARELIETPGVTLEGESPAADDYDAVIHLSSDSAPNVLAAEQALWGDPVDGVDLEATFEGVFERPTGYPARRVGFVGHDTVSENLTKRTEFDADRIHDDAELSMGFNDLYRNSVPRETNVTMFEEQQLVEPKPPGVFAQGTVAHVSKLDIDLSDEVGEGDGGWYDDHDLEGRRERMFSPHHTDENTGEVGENLGDSNAPGDLPVRDTSSDAPDLAERTERDAEEGPVGHVQKVARARFDLEERFTAEADGTPPTRERDDALPGHDGDQEAEQVILRRDVATADQNTPGNHFVALMRFNPYMAYMRQAMNGVPFDSATFGQTGDARIQHDAVGHGEDSGIVGYLETKRRANYVLPPITLRALPPAHAARPPLSVAPDSESDAVDPEGSGTLTVALGTGETAYADLASADDPAPPGGEPWVEYDEPADVDPATVRVGAPRAVNAGGGATPTEVERRDVDGDGTAELLVTVDVGETGVEASTERVRLYAETDSGFPVFATATLDDEGTA